MAAPAPAVPVPGAPLNPLENWLNHSVSIVTNEGRIFVGTLKGFDQFVNVILEDSHERSYSLASGVKMEPLGLYIVRGDNIAVIGELDDVLEQTFDFSLMRAKPLKPVVH
eukprot:TRINITY_DN15465_c0_g1_i1.p1 TRINITY_DN15465_c0_g1~~TRINITY_DN15465_c0_g1_i1.p1  ORF type:complete len:110 (+),score=33.20 TRINITY_DN15465_c0_g1_i1:2-331(+)